MKLYQNGRNNAKKTLSVAMCTYNGAQYLQEQLNSIANQSRLPDELVVCDDNSNDATLQILEKFKKEAPFKVRIYRSNYTLGSTKNFEKAISLCSGDIIALSDQDDVWMSHKLEKLETILDKHPEVGYVFSNALIVDEKLYSLGYTMQDSILFTAHQRELFNQEGHQLEILLKHNVVTGATMAFRAELRHSILPIPKIWIHDAWIALVAAILGIKGYYITSPLIKYRQHRNQVVGGLKINTIAKIKRTLFDSSGSNWKQYELELHKFLTLKKWIKENKYISKRAKDLVNSKIAHLYSRYNAQSSNLPTGIKIILLEILKGGYFKYSNTWRAIFKDFLLSFKSRLMGNLS